MSEREELCRILHDANTGKICPDPDDPADYPAMADAVLQRFPALSVLRDLVALEDEPHPNGHTSEECYAWQGDYCQRNTAAWARARALVTEHPTNEETT